MRQLFQRAADTVGGLLFFALFVVFLIQITARFGLNKPLPWTDELAVVLYIWVIVWAVAFMVKPQEHVVFDLAYNAVAPAVRRVMRMLGALLLAGLALWALPGCWDYIRFMNRESTPVLGLSFMWVFFPFLLMLAAVAVVQLKQLWRALRNEEEAP